MLPNQKIGMTLKPVGHAGEIKVQIDEPYQEIASNLKVVLLDLNGDKVPFFIEWCRELNTLVYKFEEVNNPESAKTIGLCLIYALKRDLGKDLIPDQKSWDHLEGWIITDSNQSIHMVIEKIEAYPQQDMAVANFGDKEVLIPIVDSFILEVDQKERILVMDLPDGLLDL